MSASAVRVVSPTPQRSRYRRNLSLPSKIDGPNDAHSRNRESARLVRRLRGVGRHCDRPLHQVPWPDPTAHASGPSRTRPAAPHYFFCVLRPRQLLGELKRGRDVLFSERYGLLAEVLRARLGCRSLRKPAIWGVAFPVVTEHGVPFFCGFPEILASRQPLTMPGPGRVRDWLAGRRGLPPETRAYVRVVTGESAEQWTGVEAGAEMHVTNAVPSREFAGLSLAFRSPPRAGSLIHVHGGFLSGGDKAIERLLGLFEALLGNLAHFDWDFEIRRGR